MEQEEGLRQRVQVLGWLRETKPAYDTLILRHATLTGEIGVLTKALADQSDPLEKLTTKVNTAESHLTETARSSEANRNRLAALMSLAERCPHWQQQAARRGELERNVAQNRALITDLQHELREATTALNNAEIEERRRPAEVSRIEHAQSKLQNLLTALEAHVVDAPCPACGAPYKSKDELLRRLKERRNVSVVSGEATSRLQQARARLAALQTGAEELRTRRQNAEQSVNASSAELQATVTDIAGFEAFVHQLGFDPTDVGLLGRVREHQIAAERATSELGQTLH